MTGWVRKSVLGVVLGMSVMASSSVRAQQAVTTFDGAYDTTSTADPQNAIQCSVAGGPLTVTVKDGKTPGPDRIPVSIGPDGMGESSGKLLMGGTVTLPFKIVYRFAGNSVDIDLTVTLRSQGVCIYHRHGAKK
jgi:hypothetical protein